MSRITITIRTENAAFDEFGTEIARILRVLADHLDGTPEPNDVFDRHHKLIDINGNHVGEALIIGRRG